MLQQQHRLKKKKKTKCFEEYEAFQHLGEYTPINNHSY